MRPEPNVSISFPKVRIVLKLFRRCNKSLMYGILCVAIVRVSSMEPREQGPLPWPALNVHAGWT